MTPEEYALACQRTVNNDLTSIRTRLNTESKMQILHAAVGISTEAAEVLDIIKKHVFHGKEVSIEKLTGEIGDLLFYVQLALNVTGLSLSEVMEANVDKLKKRFPVEFTEKDALERKDEE
jgi:NTP pyrophosphatase (non-canonical NTP hydrolase)